MSGAQPAGDPSMDDILASIRKILNEDEAPATVAAPPPAPAAAEEPLELTPEMMIAPPPAAPAPVQAAAPAPEPPTVVPAAAPPPEPPPPSEPAMTAPIPAAVPAPVMPPATALVTPAAAAAAAAALGELSRAVAQDRTAAIARTPGLTIEDMVREELRPMLKEWLNAHLPPLVERLVRAEIERVMAQAR